MPRGLINKVKDEISSLSRDCDRPEVIERNLNFVKGMAEQGIPELMIDEILNDPERLNEIAARSYEHVNHFDKIVLIDNDDPKGYRLTFHFWNCNYGKQVPDEELIHNHRFSFWSHIFRGKLVSENFKETIDVSIEKKTFNKFVYRPTETGNIHSCTFQDTAQLDKVDIMTKNQGETYYLQFDTIHRILLPAEGSNICTLVLRGPRQREYTNTYNTFYPDRGIESSVPMMTPDQLRHKLECILGERT